jgi:hypothetical protein
MWFRRLELGAGPVALAVLGPTVSLRMRLVVSTHDT